MRIAQACKAKEILSLEGVNAFVSAGGGLVGLVGSGRPAPAVLKIDTETTEPAVLRGGLRTIAATRPWIMCEVLAGRTEAELMTVLEPLGYTYYLVSDRTPYEPAEQLRGDPRFYMWLFAPEPAPAELWTRIAAHRAVLERCGPTAG